MKKLMKKYLFSVISVASILLIIFSVYINVLNIQSQKKEEFHTVFKHTSYILDKLAEEKEHDEDLFINSYLTRAKKIAYVLSKYSVNDALMSELSGLADITTINIVNESGLIVDSTTPDSIGLSFHDHKKLQAFLPLISDTDSNAYYVQLDGYDFTTKEDMIYLGIKPYNSVKGIIQIGLKPEILLALQNNTNISQIYTNMPVSNQETHFILDKNTGHILGITGFDDTSVEIENKKNTDIDIIKLIKTCENGMFIKLNGSWQYVYSQEYGDYILAAFISTSALIEPNIISISLIITSIIILAILMISILSFLLNKYFLAEVESLVFNINKVIDGNMNISFETNSKTEFAEISNDLNKLVHSFKNRSKRMNKMIQVIHYNVGIFEYLKEINNLFLSENIKELLNLDNEQWETFQKNNDKFISYLTDLNSIEINGKNNVHLISNNKYIQVHIYHEQQLYYGVIKDITEEVVEKNALLQKLKDVEQKMTLDKLTGLKNIHYVKETVNTLIENGQKKGIFIIFDLDNFKHVNDTIGHPEGDKLLQKFASCLKANFRDNDIIARLGGDEFVVFMLGNSSSENLQKKLNSFLHYVRKELQEYYVQFHLSVSIGVSSTSSTCTDYKSLYRNADFALYIAKQNGKDRYYINPDGLTCTHDSCKGCKKPCSRNQLDTYQ